MAGYWRYLIITSLASVIPAAVLLAVRGLTSLDVTLFAIFYVLSLYGITIGWHRMLAHRAFQAGPIVRGFLLGLGCLAVQGKPSAFAYTHIMHHAHADQDDDPHSPRHGFFHAHMGWFINYEPTNEAVARFKRDPVVDHFDRMWGWWALGGLVIPFLLGGLLGGSSWFNWGAAWGGLVWGGGMRILLVSHALWLGGSSGHKFGKQDFSTGDDSRNSFWLNFVLLGDGWHNTHHAIPNAASLASRSWHIDPQGWIIRALVWTRLATQARFPSRAEWARRERLLRKRAGLPARPVPLPDSLRPRARNERLGIAAVVGIPITGTIVAAVHFVSHGVSRLDLLMLAGFYVFTWLGMVLGYHRMLTHRAFRAHPVVRSLLLAGGGMAAMAPPSTFAGQHLLHHAHADRNGDPHSPQNGLLHAHVGWILSRDTVDVSATSERFSRDRLVVFFDRTHVLWGLAGLLLPALLGAWLTASWTGAATGFLWGGCVRVFVVQQMIFATASLSHVMGKRRFATPDGSRNVPLVLNLIQLGDGYHNHHHAIPSAANFNVHWWQLDVVGWLIALLEKLGLARDVRWARAEDWQRRERVLGKRAGRASVLAEVLGSAGPAGGGVEGVADADLV